MGTQVLLSRPSSVPGTRSYCSSHLDSPSLRCLLARAMHAQHRMHSLGFNVQPCSRAAVNSRFTAHQPPGLFHMPCEARARRPWEKTPRPLWS